MFRNRKLALFKNFRAGRKRALLYGASFLRLEVRACQCLGSGCREATPSNFLLVWRDFAGRTGTPGILTEGVSHEKADGSLDSLGRVDSGGSGFVHFWNAVNGLSYDFSTGKGYNPISFIMELHGMSFWQAATYALKSADKLNEEDFRATFPIRGFHCCISSG